MNIYEKKKKSLYIPSNSNKVYDHYETMNTVEGIKDIEVKCSKEFSSGKKWMGEVFPAKSDKWFNDGRGTRTMIMILWGGELPESYGIN